MSERLERSAHDRVLAGVCGGLAEYYVVTPGFVRAVFAIATIMTAGLFFFVYLVLALIMPPHTENTRV
jgi:phage shock protein C